MPHDESGSQSNDGARPGQEPLAALRREIDRLDDAMLALVEQRVAAAMGIAELKRSDTEPRLRLRPAREAAVIERMVAQAKMAPERLVRQVWREIMASCLGLQVNTELVLHAVRQPAQLADAMRRRFGGAAPMSVADSAAAALSAARDREAVAIVELDPTSDWWTALAGDPTLAIFECLRDGDGHLIGLAVGRIASEDLMACPQIRIVDESDAQRGELLAAAGPRRLLLLGDGQ